MPKSKKIKFSEAINLGLKIAMKKDKNLIYYGLGYRSKSNIWNMFRLRKYFWQK